LDHDGRQLHLLFVRLTLREDAAEDLMQELFLKLHSSLAFRRAKKPGAYARQAAIHLAFDWRRRRRSVDAESLNIDPTDQQCSALQSLVDREQAEQVLTAVDRLPTLMRDCVLLHYMQGEAYEYVGQCCGRTPHQVRALCYKAIVRLRKLLGRDTVRDNSSEECHDCRTAQDNPREECHGG
jgi:RNA polymerase sigma factor (sigma-70 family)